MNNPDYPVKVLCLNEHAIAEILHMLLSFDFGTPPEKAVDGPVKPLLPSLLGYRSFNSV